MRFVAVMPLVALVAACASQPPPSPAAALGPDLAEARRLLLSSDGPIPVELDAVPSVLGSDPRGTVARAASEATGWAAASFTPAPATAATSGTRLVMQFAGQGGADAACTSVPVAPPMTSPPSSVRAILCHSTRPVAEAVGRSQGASPEAVTAMVTQATSRLFPRVGGEQTSLGGWSPGAPGISLGGWLGSGGHSGVGVGLGF